ncbi:RNA polymerase sigma factor [Acidovorax sp. Leaf160]|uniref:RNA polymerase sigma factor n=1 Tax=Acidovorax sp. Leaf160 TaxID=1736280 RepID=UPI0006F6CBF5|nr:RNA polymerase sigma factor [Acidovorax sp. Leaf160]KQR43088.1 hypothetical protein ASF94_11480 [Acidovorax sp. Leaf160]
MSASPSPQQLLAAIQAGDEEAMAMLWRAWAGKVQLFARLQLAPCGPEAEPLSQEVAVDVFHDLWRDPARFDGRVAFGTWLLTLARNKSIDRLRQWGARHRREITGEGFDDAAEHHADDAPGPAEHLDAAQRRSGLLGCLRRLRNGLQREALMLWALEDLPLAEIARIQQCPENTVKTRLFHGRSHLRLCMERWLGLQGGRA